MPDADRQRPAGAAPRRLRDFGITLGHYPTGPENALTDVPGVRVGHTTLIQGDGALVPGKGPVRTGVTAIVPSDNIFDQRVIANGFVLNGAGEVSGMTQLTEWGLLETPILLTNTMSVGKVSDATIKWMTRRHPGIGTDFDVLIPIVGECDDSFLNDAVGRHIRSEHVYRAIESASAGRVAEGSVGAGTGMITCDFKGGIGTSSRRITIDEITYTLGTLVLTNFGVAKNLRIDGVPVGEVLEPDYREVIKRMYSYGSIICVVATDAPMLPVQLGRVCKRASLGIGRSGSYAAHGSGEIVVGFSTANKVPRVAARMRTQIDVLLDTAMNGFYEAVVECTEEAIANALFQGGDMTGQSGHFAPGLPAARAAEIIKRARAAIVPT